MKKLFFSVLAFLTATGICLAAGYYAPYGYRYIPQKTTQGSTDYAQIVISETATDFWMAKQGYVDAIGNIFVGAVDVSDCADLSATLTAIGSSAGNLHLARTTQSGTGLTFPSTITVVGGTGAKLSSNPVMNARFEGTPDQHFTGAPTGFGKNEYLLPDWWTTNTTPGTTDMTSAIQAALTAVASGGMVRLDGTYLAYGLTLSGTNQTICGRGTIKGDSGAAPSSSILSLSGTNSEIRDITINQNNMNSGRSINIGAASGTKIINVKSTNVQQAFIYISGAATRTYIINNQHRSRGYGVFASDPVAGFADLFILDNELSYTEATGLGDGIELNCPTNGVTRFLIRGNRIRGQIGVASNAGIGIGVSNGSDGIIAFNDISSVEADGIHLESGCDRVKVIGNSINSTGKTGAASGDGHGIAVYDSNRCIIENNSIMTTLDAHGILVSGHIADAYNTDNIIKNNQLRGIDYAAIRLCAQQRACISGNHSVSTSQDAATTYGHIEMVRLGASTKDCIDVHIEGNHIADNATAALASIVTDQATTARILVANNHLVGATTKLSLSGADNNFEFRNNRYTTTALNTTFTCSAGVSTVVTNTNSQRIRSIRIWPTNAGAAALTGVYVSAVSAGTSFTVTHSAAGGTETFGCQIE